MAEDLKLHGVVVLHKYFVWAAYMYDAYRQTLLKRKHNSSWDDPDERLLFMYMSYWYATLYVVIEGWRNLGLSDPTVDTLLASPYVALLKRYRHGVFHFQKDYFDKRYLDFVDEGKEGLIWVRSLHKAFFQYLQQWDQSHNLDGTPK